MSSEIQFGDLEESEPQRELRPDQDAHFATAMVGNVGDDELLIFVDLDVQRDMEAHALSNTRVELGGVMLGRQLIDDEGRPFVVISDSLRAEHYEATKGSFKFTHETWSQISRQRDEFRPDLEMVGWYHTHPGWSVFLSGMDLFICNNFFNRPLDVALVIDPCEQDRGWFQWNDDDQPKTQRTGGFILTTGRFRQLELDQFARVFNKEPLMHMDPRYSGNALSGHSGSAQPMVTVMENRKPAFELAVIGMLMLQFLLFSLFAWKMMAPAQVVDNEEDKEKIAKLESEIKTLTTVQNQTMREGAMKEVLSTLVSNQTGDGNLVDKYTDMRIDGARMQANLEGQLALAEKLKFERNSVSAKLDAREKDAAKLESQLIGTRKKLDKVTDEYKEFQSKIKELTGDDGEIVLPEPGLGFPTWWLGVGGLLVGLLGMAAGYAFGRREDPYERLDREPTPPTQMEQMTNPTSTDTAFEKAVDRPINEAQPAADRENVSLTIDGNDPPTRPRKK